MSLKIRKFIEKVLFENVKKDWIELSTVSAKEAKAIETKLGFNVEGFVRIIDDSAVKHIINTHGNAVVEAKIGQLAVTVSDFELIPKIVAEYDNITKGVNGRKQEVIIYSKKMGNKYFYVEEIRTGRKKLAMNTFYIKKAS
jgi:hypothetical protein